VISNNIYPFALNVVLASVSKESVDFICVPCSNDGLVGFYTTQITAIAVTFQRNNETYIPILLPWLFKSVWCHSEHDLRTHSMEGMKEGNVCEELIDIYFIRAALYNVLLISLQ